MKRLRRTALGKGPRGFGEAGQSLVELAIILPVALLLLTAAVDIGRVVFTYIALEDAAHEGAVFMAHNPAAATNAAGTTLIRNRVITSSTAPEVTGATVVTTCTVSPAPGKVTVTATAPAMSMLTPGGTQLLGGIVLTSRITATNLKEECP